ncbi:hypothetical protein [Vulcanisaeta distributa]|uniref:Uncharacterized protein n=1 Tax=Vulcanisaeta distributa (strain DSM 14429 / JCM 11212 / NBRC 100878 / IC-017) TaxID=572478 RepID=E1QSR1_VULDI|nr:hypothetical protein [Vulcanisaeta distributa]ADN49578.1 hypothetical protein Vdis_0165 [Vulcanisaeta distributa DSM 14429]
MPTRVKVVALETASGRYVERELESRINEAIREVENGVAELLM